MLSRHLLIGKKFAIVLRKHGQSLYWTSSDKSAAQVNVPSVLLESWMALVIANNPGTKALILQSGLLRA